MRIFTRLSRGLTYYLIFGFLLSTVFTFGQIQPDNPADTIPQFYYKNTPEDMDEWYDGDTINGEILLDIRDSKSNW